MRRKGPVELVWHLAHNLVEFCNLHLACHLISSILLWLLKLYLQKINVLFVCNHFQGIFQLTKGNGVIMLVFAVTDRIQGTPTAKTANEHQHR